MRPDLSPAYDAVVTKRRRDEPDLLGELQDEANWSTWRRTFAPIRGLDRRRLPSDPPTRVVITLALLGAGVVLLIGGVIWVIGSLFH